MGFSLLMPPSRMQTLGKATLTRCAANCEKKRGGGVTHDHQLQVLFPAYAFSFPTQSQNVAHFMPIAATMPWKCRDGATLTE